MSWWKEKKETITQNFRIIKLPKTMNQQALYIEREEVWMDLCGSIIYPQTSHKWLHEISLKYGNTVNSKWIKTKICPNMPIREQSLWEIV